MIPLLWNVPKWQNDSITMEQRDYLCLLPPGYSPVEQNPLKENKVQYLGITFAIDVSVTLCYIVWDCLYNPGDIVSLLQ